MPKKKVSKPQEHRKQATLTREDALALKPDFSISCLQEAGPDWRLVYTKPNTFGWVVGAVDTLGLHQEETGYHSELEANQRFHEVLRQWVRETPELLK